MRLVPVSSAEAPSAREVRRGSMWHLDERIYWWDREIVECLQALIEGTMSATYPLSVTCVVAAMKYSCSHHQELHQLPDDHRNQLRRGVYLVAHEMHLSAS